MQLFQQNHSSSFLLFVYLNDVNQANKKVLFGLFNNLGKLNEIARSASDDNVDCLFPLLRRIDFLFESDSDCAFYCIVINRIRSSPFH